APKVAVVRSMRRFTEQDHSRIAEQLQQRVVVLGDTAERLRQFANEFGIGHERLVITSREQATLAVACHAGWSRHSLATAEALANAGRSYPLAAEPRSPDCD